MKLNVPINWLKISIAVLSIVILYGASLFLQMNGVISFDQGFHVGVQAGMNKCLGS